MQDLILSIGAGPNQVPLIRAARAAGHPVWAIDRAEAPAALPLLEGLLRHSSHDPEGAVAAARPHPLAAQTRWVVQRSSGPALATAAALAEALRCIGPPTEFCGAAVRKSTLREGCASLGIPTPAGRLLAPGADLPQGQALIVKPDMPLQGKAGITVLADPAVAPGRAKEALDRAARASANGLAEVQSWLPGADVGLMLLLAGGRACLAMTYDEITAWAGRPGAKGRGEAAPRLVGLGQAAPSRHAGPRRLAALALPLAARLGMTRGFAFFSFRVDPDGHAHLYEVNPGLCGDGIAERLLPAVFPGFDPFAAEIAAWTGRLPALPAHPHPMPATVLDGQVLPGDADDNQAVITAAQKALVHAEVPA